MRRSKKETIAKRSDEEWPFDYNLAKKFREGVKQICMARAWAVIESHLGGGTDYELAEDLKVYRSNLSRYRKGRMRGEELFTFVTLIGLECKDLDPLPHVRDRVLSGYQVAVHFLRTNKIHPRNEERISYEVFMAMSRLSANAKYRAGCTAQNWKWDVIAEELQQDLQTTDVEVPFQDGAELEELKREWIQPVVKCLDSIPYGWLSAVGK